MMAALGDALADAAADPAVHVLVIAAEGNVFSAGHDLKELTAHRGDPDRGRAYFADIMGRCSRLMQAIVNHPKPVIAEVAGVATAGGLPAGRVLRPRGGRRGGAFPDAGRPYRPVLLDPDGGAVADVGRKHALEMLLTGDMVSAERAAEIGLVNKVVPQRTSLPRRWSYAERIAAKSPLTLKIGKELFQRQLDAPLADAYRLAAEAMVENMLARDAEEGIGAFLEKRPPHWSGR